MKEDELLKGIGNKSDNEYPLNADSVSLYSLIEENVKMLNRLDKFLKKHEA